MGSSAKTSIRQDKEIQSRLCMIFKLSKFRPEGLGIVIAIVFLMVTIMSQVLLDFTSDKVKKKIVTRVVD